jgi:hypothetical protein
LRTIAVLSLILMAWGYGAAPAWAPPSALPRNASVRIIPSTLFGEPIQRALVILTSVGPNKKYEKTGADLTFDRVETGLYRVEVQAVGFVTVQEVIPVYQPRVEYRIGLPLAYGHADERSYIFGVVSPLEKSPKGAWVRLVAVLSGGLLESRVDNKGRFSLAGPYPGAYVLIVFDGIRPVYARTIQFHGGTEEISVDLRGSGSRVFE